MITPVEITPTEASWLTENVAKIDFLSLLTPEDTGDLVHNARPRLVAGNETVIKEGQAGDSFFLVYDGAFLVSIDRDGKHAKLADLKRGDFFGEISLLSGKSAIATVIAKAPGKVFFLDRDQFVALVRRNQPLAAKIMDVAKARFAKRKHAIETLHCGTLAELTAEIRRFLSPPKT